MRPPHSGSGAAPALAPPLPLSSTPNSPFAGTATAGSTPKASTAAGLHPDPGPKFMEGQEFLYFVASPQVHECVCGGGGGGAFVCMLLQCTACPAPSLAPTEGLRPLPLTLPSWPPPTC